VTLVAGSACPRFAYTIGLKKKLWSGLLMAGSLCFSARQVHAIIQVFAEYLGAGLARIPWISDVGEK